ncbi:MAG: flippase-like domain-containing protein [Chloroflexi bacterium]|nr:flippase-like domain-containing protein [Chloroflexota bacterium]
MKTLRFLPWLAALGLMLLVVRTAPLVEAWAALRQLWWGQIGVLLVLNGLVLAALNGRWYLILRGQGVMLPFFRVMGWRLAAFGVSYFTPGPQFGGEPAQVLLLERAGVARQTAVASVSLDKSLELLVNFGFLLLAVTAVLQAGVLGGALGSTAVWFVLALLIWPALFLLAVGRGWRPLSRLMAFVPLWGWPAGWRKKYTAVYQAMGESEGEMTRLFGERPLALAAALFVSLLGWGLMILEFGLMFAFLGLPLTPIQLLALLVAARLALLLPLPGGLGSLAASLTFALEAMGVNPAYGVSASVLIHLRDVLLGSFGLWWGSRCLRRGA